MSTKHANQQSTQDGASLVEYTLLLSLIALVCFLAVQVLGNRTSTKLSDAVAQGMFGS